MDKANVAGNEHAAGQSRFLSAAVPLVMLATVTLLAYANAWPNSLVLDDKGFAGPRHPHALDSIVNIFTTDLWAAHGSHSGLYRPLLTLSLSLETRLFGAWLPGYHLSNIFQHLLVTWLLYGFIRHLLRRKNSAQHATSNLCALLAALIFAVHPVHTEAVDSIFNRSEIQVALFGIAGLWWLFHYLYKRPAVAWFGLGITYFLGLLCKESAIVLPALAVALILFFDADDFNARIRKCLPVFWLVLPLAIYLFMRTTALGHGTGGESTGIPHALFSMLLPDFKTVQEAAAVVGQSLKVMVWPYPLHLYYARPSMLMSVVYIVLQLGLIVVSLVQIKRKHYGFAAGLAFFYIAFLPASRIFIVGEFAPHFAERYVYFPSIGLTISLAFALNALRHHIGPRALASFGMPVLLILTAVTWDRNTDWASEASLFETEYQKGLRGTNTLRILASAQLNLRNYSRVAQICDENRKTQETNANNPFVQFCAIAYENQHRDEAAEQAYLLQTVPGDTRIPASLALASFYLRHDRRQDAEKHFIAAINWSDDPADKALYTAQMLVRLNPNSRRHGVMARDYIEKALHLRPGWPAALTLLEGLDRALNASKEQETAGERPENQ